MKITVIDGQGGRIGKTVIERIRERQIKAELYAIGTNTTATAAMLKAGADFGATGENAALVNAADADFVIGTVGKPPRPSQRLWAPPGHLRFLSP